MGYVEPGCFLQWVCWWGTGYYWPQKVASAARGQFTRSSTHRLALAGLGELSAILVFIAMTSGECDRSPELSSLHPIFQWHTMPDFPPTWSIESNVLWPFPLVAFSTCGWALTHSLMAREWWYRENKDMGNFWTLEETGKSKSGQRGLLCGTGKNLIFYA